MSVGVSVGVGVGAKVVGSGVGEVVGLAVVQKDCANVLANCAESCCGTAAAPPPPPDKAISSNTAVSTSPEPPACTAHMVVVCAFQIALVDSSPFSRANAIDRLIRVRDELSSTPTKPSEITTTCNRVPSATVVRADSKAVWMFVSVTNPCKQTSHSSSRITSTAAFVTVCPLESEGAEVSNTEEAPPLNSSAATCSSPLSRSGAS